MLRPMLKLNLANPNSLNPARPDLRMRIRQSVHGLSQRLVLSVLCASLGACAVGPDYQKPASSLTPRFENSIASVAEPTQAFWGRFQDPVLNQLIDDALKANFDIQIALANLQEARAGLSEVQANALPSVRSTFNASRQVLPQTQAPGTREERTKDIYAASLIDANWELNLFGRYTRASESAAAIVSAGEAGVHAAQVSVTAELARNYFLLRGQQQQLIVAQDALKNQSESLRLIDSRAEFGRASLFDTARARNLVESTRATIPVLEASIARTRYRIAVLTGRSPTSLEKLLNTTQALPEMLAIDGIGTPEALLKRRPDIRIAERQLAAATANIGLATAALFPSVSITGLLGFNAAKIDQLGKSQSLIRNYGGFISWTWLDFGAIRSRIDQSKAQAQNALAVYEKTVLTALEETEGALITFNRTQQQTDSLFKAAQASDTAAKLARQRLEAGATDLLIVLDAERQALAAQDAFVQAQTASATSLISIYKALGGAWTPL